MQSLVWELSERSIIDTSFMGLDATPVMASPCQNNKKSFVWNKCKPDNRPKADMDCRLGAHTASNQINERKFEYDWGDENPVLVDCITGLPMCEMTTTANVADSTMAQDMLSRINSFLSIKECYFLAGKG